MAANRRVSAATVDLVIVEIESCVFVSSVPTYRPCSEHVSRLSDVSAGFAADWFHNCTNHNANFVAAKGGSRLTSAQSASGLARLA